jgi:NhaA family Na+:H+ antiporter
VLFAAALVALVIANSPWADGYFHILHVYAGPLSIQHWVNDGLMALFFLLVGLEVKREFLVGELSSWGQRVLPGLVAIAGMAMPALIFVLLNLDSPAGLNGWAIPAATDIAFALGIVALLGSRVPPSIKVMLTAIAVIDDLLAILVIALFYTAHIAWLSFACAAGGILVLALLNRLNVRALWPYLLVGGGVWYAVLLSGVHATLAGVALALAIPADAKGKDEAPLERLEHRLQPWVNFLILPIFGFANAGLSFAGIAAADLVAPLPLGILLGLFLGKQVGIFGATWMLVRLRLADRPAGAGWAHISGMAALCGIGFTMSLFIGGLAFPEGPHIIDQVKLGVFAGSLLAGLAGWAILVLARRGPAS